MCYVHVRKSKRKRICVAKTLKFSVMIEFEIIGEAMNRALKLNPDINITSARKIVNTRNLVIHSYDSLNREILWGIVIKHLPILKQEIKLLLDSANNESE